MGVAVQWQCSTGAHRGEAGALMHLPRFRALLGSCWVVPVGGSSLCLREGCGALSYMLAAGLMSVSNLLSSPVVVFCTHGVGALLSRRAVFVGQQQLNVHF